MKVTQQIGLLLSGPGLSRERGVPIAQPLHRKIDLITIEIM
jgi:hypothetical protein